MIYDKIEETNKMAQVQARVQEVIQSHEQEQTQPTKPNMIGICQAFTDTELLELHKEYSKTYNAEQVMRKICTKLFRNERIRTLADLEDKDDEVLLARAMNIKSDFYSIQAQCVTTFKKRRKKIKHLKGDVKKDEYGNPITDGTNADGTPRFVCYDKNENEDTDILEEVPYYDYRTSPNLLEKLQRFIRGIQVLPDFDLIRAKLGGVEDFERGLELIRELTKYYEFEDPEQFVRGFAFLLCNAKAKGLNEKPTYPILFNIVGWEHGLGKGWLRDMTASTYDELFECRSTLTNYHTLLESEFNSVMTTRGFVKLDEKNMLDQRKNDQLKSLITEPEVSVNRKHFDLKQMRNLVTFFSCTNETIKDIVGLQQDRRLFEVRLVSRPKEIPEEKLRSLLLEIWRVLPCHCPIEHEIIDEMKEESVRVLDTKMFEIVSDLFNKYQDEFVIGGKFISQRKMKEALKKMGNIRYMSVMDWCVQNGVIRKYVNGSCGLSKKVLTAVLESQKRIEGSINSEATPDTNMDDLEKVLFPTLEDDELEVVK